MSLKIRPSKVFQVFISLPILKRCLLVHCLWNSIFVLHIILAFYQYVKFCCNQTGQKQRHFFLISKWISAQKNVKPVAKNTAFTYSLVFSFPWQELFMGVMWGRFLSLLRFLASLWSGSLVPYVFIPFSLYLSDVSCTNFTLYNKRF